MSSRHAGHAPTAYKGTTRRVHTRLSKDAPSGDIKWAVIVFVLVVAQGPDRLPRSRISFGGLLHGLNAFALFGGALYAGRRLRGAAPG